MIRASLVWLACIVWLATCLPGCSSGSTEQRKQALGELRKLVDGLSDKTRLLAFQISAEVDTKASGPCYWCVITETEPTPISERPIRPVDFPASSLFSFAAQVGADASNLGQPAEKTGTFYEWSVEHQEKTFLVRLRSVSTNDGVLSVIESSPQ